MTESIRNLRASGWNAFPPPPGGDRVQIAKVCGRNVLTLYSIPSNPSLIRSDPGRPSLGPARTHLILSNARGFIQMDRVSFDKFYTQCYQFALSRTMAFFKRWTNIRSIINPPLYKLNMVNNGGMPFSQWYRRLNLRCVNGALATLTQLQCITM